MATPIFGFSVGDFIAGIRVVLDIYRACKERGGAAAQSQATITELEAYCHLLSRIEEDEVDRTDLNDKVKNLLSVCRTPIQHCLERLLERWSAPVFSQNQTVLVEQRLFHIRSFRRKAKWALSDADEVQRLRAQIAPSMTALGILLDVEIRSSLRNALTFHSDTTNALAKSHHAAFEIAISDLNRRLETQSHETLVIGSEISTMRSTLATLTEKIESRQLESTPTFTRSINVGTLPTYIVELKRKIQLNVVNASTLLNTRSNETGINKLPFLVALNTLLRLCPIQIIVPYTLLIKRMLNNIGTIPTMLLSDNIIFIDALGREASLSYSDFRHWPIFAARLGVTFGNDVPSSHRILHGRYMFFEIPRASKMKTSNYLTTAYHAKGAWSSIVKPRAKIMMAVQVTCTKLVEMPHIRQYFCYKKDNLKLRMKNLVRFDEDFRLLQDVQMKMLTHVDWTDCMEFGHLKNACVITKHRVRSSIEGFQRAAPRSSVEIAIKIMRQMSWPLISHGNSDYGYLLLAKHASRPDLIRMGCTSSDISRRLHKWQQDCHWTPELLPDPNQRQAYRYIRIWKLVRAVLSNDYLEETSCDCRRIHSSWLQVSSEVALSVIERWRRWMETVPYSANGLLKEYWERKIIKEKKRLFLFGNDGNFPVLEWLNNFLSPEPNE